MHAIDPLYSVCGFVGGLLVGVTGVGGGSLMTPLLILLFGSIRRPQWALRIILAVTLAVVGSKLAFEQIQSHLATVVSSSNQ